ncbi:type IA DNA topoisomerase [Symbiobacterium terraclitae]|uniref:type IA DNA topoisomerase n=1 Tax=Symbiobacterium terraclitae TaxID=557451 RepID=UPI0035B53C60
MSGKPLIIAEKPSAAQAIAEALGGFRRREGYLESSDYLLSWAVGHLVELQAPEEYDPRWKRWAMATLPIIPDAFRLKVLPRTRAQFQVLARLGKQAPRLINACDSGREGELIFRYICQAAGLRAPVQRLWVSALTPEAIRKAFAELRPQAQYDRLYQSARCRAEGDWLVGINATRAFTVKWGDLLSAGRVQTPTLAMLVRREREIEAFRPEPYWEVVAEFVTDGGQRYAGKWFGPEGDRLPDAQSAQAVVERVHGAQGAVESCEAKPVAERPPQLFDLTSLQREANRRYGLTAAATLKAAQALYEARHITYPRTDSRYLAAALVPELPRVVRALGGLPDLASLAAEADLKRVHRGNRRVVDDARVTDHHAIIPTTDVPRGLAGAEARIYDLIARRFLAQFYPDARFLEQEVVTRVGPYPDRFRSRGRQVLDPGWRRVEPEPVRSRRRDPEAGEEEDAPQVLPPLEDGQPVCVGAVESRERTTRPPRRYTEATLLSAMEYAGREVTDEALREAMKGHGLGTPATRAAIIERLKEVGYVRSEKKTLLPTPKGRRMVELVEAAGAAVLLSPELTGEWERRIAAIQAGEYDPGRFMQEIRELTAQVVAQVRSAPGGSPVPAEGGSAARVQVNGAEAGPDAAPDEGDAPDVLAVACPRCGGAVRKGSRGWTCAREGCSLRVPAYLCGKVVDRGVAEEILTRGRSQLIRGFTSPRTGRSFAAFLVLKEGGEVGFEFPPDRPRRPSGSRAGTAGRTRRTRSRAGTQEGRSQHE